MLLLARVVVLVLIAEYAASLKGTPHYKEAEDIIRGPHNSRFKRKVSYDARLWERNIRHWYYIDPSANFTVYETKNIRTGFRAWSMVTCLIFEESKTRPDSFYVKIIREEGCWSYLGSLAYQRIEYQPISLDYGCAEVVGTVLHEIGHMIGLEHEHTRQDRNNGIFLEERNIPAHKEMYFRIFPSELFTPYDVTSVMQYSQTYYSSVANEPTIGAVDKNWNSYLGQRKGISFYDIVTVNLLYQCNANCDPATSVHCANQGLVMPSCDYCSCPPGLSPYQHCEVPTTDQYQTPNWCNGNIILTNLEPEFTLEFKHDDQDAQQRCVWLATAPEGYIIDTYFENFTLPYDEQTGECKDSLEIRTGYLGTKGPIFCGDSLAETFDSVENTTLLQVLARPGALMFFRAKLKMRKYPQPECSCGPGAVCNKIGKPEYRTYSICLCAENMFGWNCDKRQSVGEWTEWSGWSECRNDYVQSPCESKTRYRKCKERKYGGKECSGETWSQNTTACAKNPQWRQCENGGYWQCSFGAGEEPATLCGIVQDKFDADSLGGSNIDWSIIRGPSPRAGDVPNGAVAGATGRDDDAYLIAETAEMPNGTVTRYFLPQFSQLGTYCFAFKYYMSGPGSGKLAVSLQGNEVWWRAGQKESRWYEEMVTLNAERNVNGIVVSLQSIGYADGDVAMDDLAFWPGKCKPRRTDSGRT